MDEAPHERSRMPDPMVVGQRVSHYVVESPLGAGGMGQVFLAQDLQLARKVALKRVSPELRGDPRFQQRLVEEANRAIQISDPRIAAVLDVVQQDDEIFLVLEYVPGEPLRERLGAPLSLHSFIEIAIECTEALAAAHHAGVVHHDIKPENFMVLPNGHVKLLDLGLATSVLASDTLGSEPAGTPLYMAPEALRGNRADERSDLFSLGAVFYEMLTGTHPFRGKTPAASRDRILHHAPESLLRRNPGVPARIERLLRSMLAKSPADRPASALDVLRELLELRKQVHLFAEAATVPLRLVPPPPIGRRRLILTAGSILLLIGWFGGPAPPRPLPREPYLAIREFSAGDGRDATQAIAAGLEEVVRRTLQRLTDPRAVDATGPAAASFRPLPRIATSSNQHADLMLGAQMMEDGAEWRVSLVLLDGRDSTTVRRDIVSVHRDQGLALANAVVECSVRMLDLNFPLQQLPAVWHPGTQNPAAFLADLAGLGNLSAWAATENRPALLDSAAAAFRRAAAADTNDTWAWMGQAQALWCDYQRQPEPSRLQQAAGLCQKALGIDLDCAEAYALLGELNLAKKRYPAAVSDLERACELDPTDDASRRLLVETYRRSKQRADAERTLRSAVERRPRNPYWHSYFGYFCFQETQYDSAIRHYQRAIDLAPRAHEARNYAGLGAACLRQGRYQTAIPHLHTASTIDTSASNYSALGTAYYMLRRFGAAESTYQRAIELRGDDFVLWDNLGDAYDIRPEQRDRATQAYRRALLFARRKLVTAPEDAILNARIAHYYAQIGVRDSACSSLQRALQLAPHDGDVLYRAALVYQRIGRPDSAFAILGRALAAGQPRLWVQDTPELDPLRSDPRFEQLLRR